MSNIPERFRQTNDYAGVQGFNGGFPNFHQADYGEGVVYGTVLLKSDVAEQRDVSAAELGDPQGVEEMFRAVNGYAGEHGFNGGFPNFHQADYGEGVVYGVVLLKSDAIEQRDVPAAELGDPQGVGEMFRAVNGYAGESGFNGGFPNFHQADYGEGVVYGVVLLKSDAVEQRDVPAAVMNMFTDWPFDSEYTRKQRHRVLERHCFAYSRIFECSNLTQEQKNNLADTYKKTIRHSITNDPTVNGSARGLQIWVNAQFIDNGSNDELAQTLIHEMMHCAGYSHPERQPTDVPGDNGPYYGSPPLQAEICIAGTQSDEK